MTFLNLEYFVEVAESLNLTKSAVRLHITQQSLSNHIQKLEQYYNTALFRRSPALRLTEAGELLAVRARELLQLKKGLDQEMSCFLEMGTQTLNLATNGGNLNFLPEFLITCGKEAPNIRLVIVQPTQKSLVQRQIPDNVDFIFGYLPFSPETTDYIALRPDPLVALIPDSVLEKTFPGQLDEVKERLARHDTIRVMAQCPFIMPSYHDRLSEIIEDLFKRNGVRPNLAFTANTLENAVSICMRGIGVTIGSADYIKRWDPVLRHGTPQGLSIIPIDDELSVATLALGWHRNRKQPQSFNKFIAITRKFFAFE